MNNLKGLLTGFLFVLFSFGIKAQCNQTMAIHSTSSTCSGGVSTVTMVFSITFGGGNNSITLDYDLGLGGGPVEIIIFEDNGGDMLNATLIFNIPSCTAASLIMTAHPNPAGGGNACTDPAPIVIENVVPVTFGEVNLKEMDEAVEINWITHSERNNEKFIIERSKDDYKFEVIGEVAGQGDSNREQNYSFIDNNPLLSSSFYRIKQVDYDGKYDYSDIRRMDRSRLQNIRIYPNPANEIIHVAGGKSGTYSITDGSGKVFLQFDKNDSTRQIDVTTFLPGLYYLQSSTDGIVDRFVKL